MTAENDESSAERHDDLNEMFAAIKRIEPSLAGRVKNRTVIAAELARLEQRRQTRTGAWWKRSISLPVPAALGYAALLVATTLVWLAPSNDVKRSPAAQSHSTAIASQPQPAREYYASEIYLCGVGQVSTESTYSFQE